MNELLFVRSTGFRNNGLNWTATPVGSQREGPGRVTSEELGAKQKVNTVRKSKRDGAPSSRSVTKGHLGAL